MVAVFNSQPPSTVRETIAWLLRLGRPPLPECPIEAAKQGKESKAPCFLDGKYLKSVNWKEWQNAQPIQEIIDAWFKSPHTGIGTLGGWNGKHWLGWIDFDQKDFASSDECDRSIEAWVEQYPVVANAPMFRTPSGGYRFLVAFSREPENFKANSGFSLKADGSHHVGELLSKNGGHTLLPPTIGVSGKPYIWVQWSEYPPIVEQPKDIGLYPVQKRTKTKPAVLPVKKNVLEDTSLTELLKQEIYPRLTAEQAFNWYGHDFKEYGDKLKGNCFQHESQSGTAFYVENKDDQWLWRCPACDIGGSVIEYRYQLRGGSGSPRGKDFVDIVRELANETGVPFPENSYSTDRSVGPKGERNSNIIQLSEFTSAPPSSFEETMERVRQIQEIEDEARQAWEMGLLAKSVRAFSAAQLLNIYKVKEQNLKTFAPIDIHDFLAQGTDEREWLVAAHISVGTTLVLFSDGGVGKTLLGYDIGKAIATNKPWNGFRVRQGKVLIVQTDEPEIDTRERLNIANFAAEVARGTVQIETNWQFSQIRRLRDWIQRERPVFVMIDSFTSANRAAGDQEKDATYASCLYELRDIANEYGCAIMVLHHENKGGGSRGTTANRNNVSEVWRLRKGDPKENLKPTQRILDIEKSRSGCSGTFKIDLNVEDYSWQHLGDFGADENSAGLPLSARLLNYLEARPGMKFEPEELTLEFSGTTKDAIRKQLERLRKKGLIDHEERVKQRETGTVRYKVYYAPLLGASVDPETAKTENEDNLDKKNSEIKKDGEFLVQVTPKNAETYTESNLDNLDNKPGQPGQVSRLEQTATVDGNSNLDKNEVVQVMSRLGVQVVQVAPAMDLSDFRDNLDSVEVDLSFSRDSDVRVKLPLTSAATTKVEESEVGTPESTEPTSIDLGSTKSTCLPKAQNLDISSDVAVDPPPTLGLPKSTLESIEAPTPAVEPEKTQAIAPQPSTEEPFKVDDQVFWDDCPSHCAWMNPFRITAIQGGMAHLDFMEILAPLADLRRVP